MQDYARTVSRAKGLNTELFLATIKCESSWNPTATGDSGKSHGLAQIHSPSHPTVTRAQATDPKWAIDWMADRWAKGYAHQWTCYRKLKHLY